MKIHGILKRLRSKKEIVITRPNKGNDLAIFDKTFYEENILKLISDANKFKKLNQDPKLTRGGQMQRFLRKIKDR